MIAHAPEYGEFGGEYVPELLIGCPNERKACYNEAKDDPEYWKEYRSYYPYMAPPSLHPVASETGAGPHGVATATACTEFGMKCTICMGAEYARRQALNGFSINMVNLNTTHYLIGSAIGSHPFPIIVRRFQNVISIGNAFGLFSPFIEDFMEDPSVPILGVEAGGDGLITNHQAATPNSGLGCFARRYDVHSSRSQDINGHFKDTHSVSAGLEYPGICLELSSWKDAAFQGFRLLSQLEGIAPALETAHVVYDTMEVAKVMPKGKIVIKQLSVLAEGEKDVQSVAERQKFGPTIG
ncbi:tryptophan synthase beta chain 1 [Hypoxylon fuscum]|nr:tryptophan synthase beta chain 1 [Hypoxylon fuscum]